MSDGDAEPLALIGDVGGTNCRLAVTAGSPGAAPRIERVRTYRCADYATFEDAVATYLREEGVSVTRAVIAVAGPVADGAVAMTNHPWRITERGLAAALGGAKCRLINDFEALAHALPALTEADLKRLGPPRAPATRGSMAVMGAGTGFGTAALVAQRRRPGGAGRRRRSQRLRAVRRAGGRDLAAPRPRASTATCRSSTCSPGLVW